jgi:hypothetical protein
MPARLPSSQEVGVAAEEYALLVARYRDPQDALADLRWLTGPGPLGASVAGAAILDRYGPRPALQQGGGGTLAYSIGTGAAAGIVAGVVVSLPLVGAAAGAAVGALVGRRMGRQEVETLVQLLDDAVPPGSAGLLAVVDEAALPLVRGALDRAQRVTARVLDEGPLTTVARSLVRGNPEVTEVLDRQRHRGDGNGGLDSDGS